MIKTDRLDPRRWIDLLRKKTNTVDAGHGQTADSEAAGERLSYWKSRLRNPPPRLELPAAPAAATGGAPPSAVETLSLEPSLCRALDRLAAETKTTPYAILLAVYVTLLYRYTAQEEFIVACTETDGALPLDTASPDATGGPFLVRPCVTGEEPFLELLGHLAQEIDTAHSHLPLPLAEILQDASIGTDRARLFQVRFAIEGVARTGEPADDGCLQNSLSLHIHQDGESLQLRLQHDGVLFGAATGRGLLSHYRQLLVDATLAPARPLAELAMLTAEEQYRLLTTWNDSQVDFPAIDSLQALIESRVAESPGAIAVTFRDEHLSYGALNARANQLAHHLRTLGVEAGVLVGIYMERCIDAVVAILAVWKAGGSYLPLDAGYPEKRLSYIMNDARANILLTHDALAESLTRKDIRVIRLDVEQERLARHSTENPTSLTRPDHSAFVLYTSGSTGNPKGVEITHANLLNYFFAWDHTQQLRTSINAICQTAFFSFAVFQGDVVRALCAGKRLLLCPRESLLSPRQLYDLMRREEVDFAEFVPVLLRALTDFIEESRQDLGFMKVIVVGADRWYVREHRRVQALCPPPTRLIHVYGLSETTLDSTWFKATDAGLDEHQLVPIGQPFPNIRAYILDAHRKLVPAGVIGTLHIGGAGIARGYYQRPDLTAERFVPDPFGNDEGARLYDTGDLARHLPDGNIAFLGRSDQQVKIRGFRVEPGEVEAALELHPRIHRAIVQPLQPNAATTQLAAYCTFTGDIAPSSSEIRHFLAGKLPEFMLPAYYVPLDALPLTPSGKIDRRALPAPADGPAHPDEKATDATDETQQTIIAICKHALGLDQLAPDDDFAGRGGDSMAIMTMVTGLENHFGIVLEEDEITPALFTSVNTLTAYVKGKTGAGQV